MNKNSLEYTEKRVDILERQIKELIELIRFSNKIHESHQQMIELLIEQKEILHKRLELLEK